MRLGLVFTSLLTAGCRQIFGVEPPGPLVDAAPEIDAPDAYQGDGQPPATPCFADDDLHLEVCLPAFPTTPVTLGDVQLDTDTDARCIALSSSALDELCVIAGTDVTVTPGATIVATGNRPLVLWATHTLFVQGSIDVASHRAAGQHGILTGAGFGSSPCSDPADPTTRGGGAGGTFVAAGGNGGHDVNTAASVGGIAALPITPTSLRAGCSGGVGADSNTRAGDGGGAVALVGHDVMFVGGTVNASGAGGTGGVAPFRGGSGGGSGGMIAIIAATVSVDATSQLFANGGGGGGGGGNSAGGSAGGDPTGATVAGAGGSSPIVCNGGSGYPSVQAGRNSSSVLSVCAGGGGGGGPGVIHISGTLDSTGKISPSPI